MNSSFTMTLSDLSAIAGIVVVISGLLWFVIRQSLGKITSDMALELVKSENRISEKIKLQFAEKSITELQMKEIQKDVEELKKESGK